MKTVFVVVVGGGGFFLCVYVFVCLSFVKSKPIQEIIVAS